MLYRVIRRVFRNLPFLQDSLEQDYHNPLQRDRLPPSGGVELDFPVISGTLAENKRRARKQIGIMMAVAFGCAIIFQYNFYNSAPYLLGLAATVGFVLSFTNYVALCKRFRWLYLLIVMPHLALAVLMIHQPVFLLTMAMLMSLFAADLFATHYFHLQTTAPLDRQRALTLRALWKKRFGAFRAVTGAELYLLLFVGLAAVPPLFVVWNRAQPPRAALENAARLSVLLVGMLMLPLLVELLAAFLYARRRIGFRPMFSHLFAAVTYWLTYNRTGIDAPGAYQTPAGTCRQRRLIALGLALMFAAVIPQIVNLKFDFQNSRFQEPAPGDVSDLAGTSLLRTPSIDLDSSEPQPGFRGTPPAPLVALEPYQERMLERMSVADRKAYLETLSSERAAELAEQTPPTTSQSLRLSNSPYVHQLIDHLKANAFESALARIYLLMLALLYPLYAAVFSVLFPVAAAFVTTGRLIGFYGATDHLDPESVLSADTWDGLVARVQASADPEEQQSLILGVNARDHTPILVPRSVFTEHAHLLGDSGSGKTSLGIASILSQLIRPGDCSVVVLDLKGDDLAMFQGVKRDAEAAGLRFRWFTNQLEQATYAFNPLTQHYLERMTVYQKTDMLTAAMGLQYGRDYGRAYYSDANARLLHAALSNDSPIASFRQLADVLSRSQKLPNVDAQLRQAAAHLLAIVNRLADSQPLNVTPAGEYPAAVTDNAIQFTDVFRTPQAVHFHLTSTIGTTSSAEIARIALYSLITAATMVPPAERVQTFVVIDEFQRIVAGNIELLLQLARSLNIGIILANQSLMDLRTAGTDLIAAISANTRFRQVFAASNLEEQERLVRGSGEALSYTQTWKEYLGGIGTSIDGRSLSETITPRLRINDILLATDHPQQSIVQIRRGAGYAQYGGLPFVMRSTHHISYQEFNDRRTAGWPTANAETLVPHIPQPQAPPAVAAFEGKRQGSELFVDEPQVSSAGGHYLDSLIQKQPDPPEPTATTEEPSRHD